MNSKQSAPEARRHYRHRESLIRTFAKYLGRTENGVGQSLFGPKSWRVRITEYVTLLQKAGQTARARKFLQPLADLMRETPIAALELPVIAKASAADSREELAQAIAQETRALPDLEKWLKAVDEEIAAQSELRAALWSEIQARRGA